MRVRHDDRVAHRGERGFVAAHQPAVLEEIFARGVE
jgi:hypothetical protein